MKLVNINKNGTQKFQLKDGRIIYSYNSGYVRIDNKFSDRLYQINKTRKYYENRECWTGEIIKMEYTERILIPCPSERFQYIKDWVKRNTFFNIRGQVLPYSTVQTLRRNGVSLKLFTNTNKNYDY